MNNNISFYKSKIEDPESKILSEHLFPELKRGADYKPSEELIHAIDVAIMLQKPLLVTGVPGTGKSELAYHISNMFFRSEPHFFATRTDSVANDLLYRYDSLAHFNAVNVSKNSNQILKADDIKAYIHLVGLGKAIEESALGKRSVVLIDEIDKAPRDLPNDILSVIETMSFDIPELKAAPETREALYKYTGKHEYKPIVILTSNSEKTLPEAFLRRCVFFHIQMPKQPELTEILLRKKSLFSNLQKELADDFTRLFEHIRNIARVKKPATHELILWTWWMLKHKFTPTDVYQYNTKAEDTDTKERNKLLLSMASVLVKESDDWARLRKAIEEQKINTNTQE
jgi:MoxR-like ATPase